MIHPEALKKVRTELEDTLKNCEVDKGLPVFSSYSDKLLNLAKEVIKHTKDWLTISSIYSIFIHWVSSALKEKFPKQPDISGVLRKLLGDEKIEEIIRSILEYIRSIPRMYSIYFPMPILGSLMEDEISLSENVSVVQYSDKNTIPGGYRGGSLERALGGVEALELNRPYIRIVESGYAGGLADDSAFIGALSKFKQFVHLALLYRVFQITEDRYIHWALRETQYSAIIIDNAETNVVACSTRLAGNIAQYIGSIEVNRENVAQQRDERVPGDYLRNVLRTPLCLIDPRKENSYALPVKSAVEWAFDSSINDNDTVAFLQMCIGLEAILGDDAGQEFLTEILADRCGYLLGTSIQRRKSIKKKFKKFYRLRSKLVHGRTVRLQNSEKYYLNWGKKILDCLIWEEIKNLNLQKT